MANTPIKRINELDLRFLAKTQDETYYVCSDTHNIYHDFLGKRDRQTESINIISTELIRKNGVTPVAGKRYYVWETNILYQYVMGAWTIIAGETILNNGQVYNNNTEQLTNLDGETIIDNNGLLRDGSVCVRDLNRTIKGRIYIDSNNNNLVVSSYMGGGFRLMPNGSENALGSLVINPTNQIQLHNVETDERLPEIYGDILANQLLQAHEYDIIQRYKAQFMRDNPQLTEQEALVKATAYVQSATFPKKSILIDYGWEYEMTNNVTGFGMYNGEFNTTDNMYVNLNSISSQELVGQETHHDTASHTFSCTTTGYYKVLYNDFTPIKTSLTNDYSTADASPKYVEIEDVNSPVTLYYWTNADLGNAYYNIYFTLGDTSIETHKYKVLHEGNILETLQEMNVAKTFILQDSHIFRCVHTSDDNKVNVGDTVYTDLDTLMYVCTSKIVNPSGWDNMTFYSWKTLFSTFFKCKGESNWDFDLDNIYTYYPVGTMIHITTPGSAKTVKIITIISAHADDDYTMFPKYTYGYAVLWEKEHS